MTNLSRYMHWLPASFGYLIIVLLLVAPLSLPAADSQQDEAKIRAQLARLSDSSSAVRAESLKVLIASRDARLIDFLSALNEGSVYEWQGGLAICPKLEKSGEGIEVARLLDPLTREPVVRDGQNVVVRSGNVTTISISRDDRRRIGEAIRLLELWSPDTERRLGTIKRFGDSRDAKYLEPLQTLIDSQPAPRIERKARESLLLIRVGSASAGQHSAERVAAIRELGQLRSARAVPLLQEILKNPDEESFHSDAYAGLQEIEAYQQKVRFAQNTFNGISAASILVLMALGLSIIFGQMRVINMAHGELMMIGAYATYEMQLLFGHSPDNPSNLYFIVALPVAFCASALVGYAVEKLVVRHLYGRPMESLLATWGVSMILIQAVRIKYGDNIGVNSPTWLVGSFELVPDLVIPINRGFILLLCGLCVGFVYWLMTFTRLGLFIRATVQNRQMANCLGVNTERIDGYTFALGSGLAGIAGFALTTVAGVSPDMGQNYIVDSFLVVVTGGVGSLWGSVFAGLGIGILNKLIEPMSSGLGVSLVLLVVSWVLLVMRAFKTPIQGSGKRVVNVHESSPPTLSRRIQNWFYDRRWGLASFLVPVPLPLIFGLRQMRSPGIKPLLSIYLAGLFGVVVTLLKPSLMPSWLQDIANLQLQATWAKVLILMCVVVFIQWEPLGLFAPRGRQVSD